MMQATDWLNLAKEVLDSAIAVYNSDDKGRRRHVNRLFEAAAKFAHQGKKCMPEGCRSVEEDKIIAQLEEIIAVCDQYRIKKGCKRLEKNQTTEE